MIQDYKISLKNYKHHESATMQKLRQNLQNSIQFYDEEGNQNFLEYLPE